MSRLIASPKSTEVRGEYWFTPPWKFESENVKQAAAAVAAY